ncbi:MAG: YdiU family protein [Acidaminobacteraceae bacterium]
MKINIKAIGWNIDNSYSKLNDILYDKQDAQGAKNPKLVLFNDDLAHKLGLNADSLNTDTGARVLSGSLKVDGSVPIAQAYAGHQYGHFTMLGDGRALLLFEHIAPTLIKYDVQLKGSGRTKYSRGGDGLATLSSMLREYIMSEAMNALSIPTTRSLAVVDTGEAVLRERRYDGAMLTRISRAHIRVGTFQYAIANDPLVLKELADYTIDRLYPECSSSENPYLELLKTVTKKQAKLLAQWQSIAFIHGVMNTDNMSIACETIDYGPCAFMNVYDPKTVFSSIDRKGRYAYENQPGIANWNIARFAETLLDLIHEDREIAVKLAENIVNSFPEIFTYYYMNLMRSKLGIFHDNKDDDTLIAELLTIMKDNKLDFTNTFANLSLNIQDDKFTSPIKAFDLWLQRWKLRLSTQSESLAECAELMKKNNPRIIPRNHQVEYALKSATENRDYEPINNLINALSKPFDYPATNIGYTLPPEANDEGYKTYCGT